MLLKLILKECGVDSGLESTSSGRGPVTSSHVCDNESLVSSEGREFLHVFRYCQFPVKFSAMYALVEIQIYFCGNTINELAIRKNIIS
jgi:hypothetical protein